MPSRKSGSLRVCLAFAGRIARPRPVDPAPTRLFAPFQTPHGAAWESSLVLSDWSSVLSALSPTIAGGEVFPSFRAVTVPSLSWMQPVRARLRRCLPKHGLLGSVQEVQPGRICACRRIGDRPARLGGWKGGIPCQGTTLPVSPGGHVPRQTSVVSPAARQVGASHPLPRQVLMTQP